MNSRNQKLYRVAGVCAALSVICFAVTLALQLSFLSARADNFADAGELILRWIKAGQSISSLYDLTVFPGLFLLTSFMNAFALVCFLSKKQQLTRKTAALINGIGLSAFAGLTFAIRIFLIAVIYFEENSRDESLGNAVLHIATNVLGYGYFELLFFSLFALSMILTAVAGKYRPLATSLCAVCIYQLFRIDISLFTRAPSETQTEGAILLLHSSFYLLAMLLSLCSAAIVAMSSPEGGREINRCA